MHQRRPGPCAELLSALARSRRTSVLAGSGRYLHLSRYRDFQIRRSPRCRRVTGLWRHSWNARSCTDSENRHEPDGAPTMTSRIETSFTEERPRLTTNQKALKINLDPLRYGTFAEIGAGQEVARWFFKVGAAAGSISKSMSAYDMTVSDAIYGRCKRYVSRERLQSMLDYEHGLNLERLRPSRGSSTAFFAFADTVAARN